MKTNKLSIIVSAIILAFPALVYSQEYSVNPNSIFGIGDVNMSEGGRLAGMGGVGIAIRGNRVLNTINPAAISALDSTTFIFDIAASGKGSKFTSGGITQTNFNANFTKISTGWRLTPKWVIGAFVQPYSTVSDKVKKTDYSGATGVGTPNTTTYTAKGGLTRFCITNSFDLTKTLSAGINTTFLFGGIETIDEEEGVSIKRTSRTSKVMFEFGLQYHKPIGDYELGFGLTGGYRNLLTFKNSRQDYNNNVLIDDIPDYNTEMIIPEYYGGGISLSKGSSLLISLDYHFQRWSLSKDEVHHVAFTNTNKLMGGVAFIPNEQHATSYFGIIQYQAGFTVGNSYLNLYGHNTIDYEFFMGGAFPLRGGSLMNVALSYGRKGTSEYDLIREDYFRATFTFSILERWFLKRLYD
jgi:hypothetical protein